MSAPEASTAQQAESKGGEQRDCYLTVFRKGEWGYGLGNEPEPKEEEKHEKPWAVFGPHTNSLGAIAKPIKILENHQYWSNPIAYVKMCSIDAEKEDAFRATLMEFSDERTQTRPKAFMLAAWNKLYESKVISKDNFNAGWEVMEACGLKTMEDLSNVKRAVKKYGGLWCCNGPNQIWVDGERRHDLELAKYNYTFQGGRELSRGGVIRTW
ncbi:hypothetical protein MAJ_11333, partial [Metarhizium majus ARSEF 297]